MSEKSMILVLGATGMLGSAVLRFFAQSSGFSVIGSARSLAAARLLPESLQGQIVGGIDVHDMDVLLRLFDRVRPDIVINCVGLVKQLTGGNDPLTALPVNSMFPHRLLGLCRVAGSRLIHISTDCVFAGTRGMYGESDIADARDIYGLSKYLGEVHDSPAITLRTSIVGPELDSTHGLLGWFLAQRSETKGFTRAIFSGLPTVELARIIRDFVIPKSDMSGLYHVSAAPISKHDLLLLVAREYGKAIQVIPDGTLVIDRSLDSTRFREQTSYVPPGWPQLVRFMREFG
jgi:dTDP-4-dehydrorhamnose reductase